MSINFESGIPSVSSPFTRRTKAPAPYYTGGGTDSFSASGAEPKKGGFWSKLTKLGLFGGAAALALRFFKPELLKKITGPIGKLIPSSIKDIGGTIVGYGKRLLGIGVGDKAMVEAGGKGLLGSIFSGVKSVIGSIFGAFTKAAK